MKHTSIDKSGIRSKGMTKSQNAKERQYKKQRQQVADRVKLVIDENSYSGTYPSEMNDNVMGDIRLKPLYMFPTTLMQAFTREFDTFFLDTDGYLVIG